MSSNVCLSVACHNPTVWLNCVSSGALWDRFETCSSKYLADMGEPTISITPMLSYYSRFPNIVVSGAGTVIAVFSRPPGAGIFAKRSEDGGETWGALIDVSKISDADAGSWTMGGGVTVSEGSSTIFAFCERWFDSKAAPMGRSVYLSEDDGRTWRAAYPTFTNDTRNNPPDLHMNEHGIALQRGPHRGRLIRPTRSYAGQNYGNFQQHYTGTIMSDDGGASWRAGEPLRVYGVGEAAIVELSNGTLLYNTRRHWAPPEEGPPLRRWAASSHDGGETWSDVRLVPQLPDGPQNSPYGLMGGLTRLPLDGFDVLLFSNVDSCCARERGTIWVSLDGGLSWPIKRLVPTHAVEREEPQGEASFERLLIENPRHFGYSSLVAGRPGTQSEGWIYLLYEGPRMEVVRLNLAWVLFGGIPNVPFVDEDSGGMLLVD